ncbi:glycine betaine ABC transporter substrate-binding protein [Streptomyces millisiae]|uniref:Glycine betaine ABC transporter substrate-binding protein n=1 Tax=Streptomyces millisiae TaxID=3075542 RepID=A0ABU2LQW1_9ACTN|nr:glycine betaine ABC transporter substrate-binding protein [Streptomyces sp. DSM 44918]MDT0319438.1 glycine betaine ABC transporter substrate-binding protein [Streptomyces sp. DSM 44918]
MRIRHPLFAGMGALSLLAVSGCELAGGVTGRLAEDEREPVVIAVPAWPGGQANAAVAAHVLENELDVPVRRVELGQREAWEQLGQGSVQAVLEDWGALPDVVELYVDRKEQVVGAGELGITGHVGWYVPEEFAEANPGVLDWRNLNDFAGELGGRLLHGDPEYATRDEAIVEDLDLAYRPVAAGSEDALVEEIAGAAAAGEPLLTYFWEPHWLSAEVPLAEIQLPAYYPRITLQKYLNAEFAEAGGAAVDFLRNFSWSAEDQNAVAELIAGEGMTPAAAAERWVTEHPDTVAGWLE